MSANTSNQWREKASGFFFSSGAKLKKAGRTVGGLAKDAGDNVANVADRFGSLVKKQLSLAQQNRQPQNSREGVQDLIHSAATTTGELLKRGISETKEKVTVGKIRVEEAAKQTANKSKTVFSNIERWHKGIASSDVFGVPLEKVVLRQNSSRPVPQILVKCADYLVLSGLQSENLFKADGDRRVVQNLVSIFNNDWNASIPDGTNPVDVAAVIKLFLLSLPEPLTTVPLYLEIKETSMSISEMRNVLKKLPNANYSTLEFLTALLLQVSQKSNLNRMDAHSLAVELAEAIMCQKVDERPNYYVRHGMREITRKGLLPRSSIMNPLRDSSKLQNSQMHDDLWDDLSDDGDATSSVPLDDERTTDFAAVDVVQILIEHHNAVFTDANETTWE